jgi:hypothetical protein
MMAFVNLIINLQQIAQQQEQQQQVCPNQTSALVDIDWQGEDALEPFGEFLGHETAESGSSSRGEGCSFQDDIAKARAEGKARADGKAPAAASAGGTSTSYLCR